MSSRRPIAAVDATWLRMGRPHNLMVIESVVWFDTPVDWDRVSGVIRRRMVALVAEHAFAQRWLATRIH